MLWDWLGIVRVAVPQVDTPTQQFTKIYKTVTIQGARIFKTSAPTLANMQNPQCLCG